MEDATRQLSKIWDGLTRQWAKLKTLSVKKEYVDFCDEEEKAVGELLKDKKDIKILDVGCGCGRIIEKVTSKAEKVYGMDISLEMLKTARKKLPDSVVLMYQDVTEKWPFKDEFFDFIACTGDALGNVSEPKAVMKETERCLKTGGNALFGVLNAGFLDESTARETYEKYETPFKFAKLDIETKTVQFDGGGKSHWFTKEEIGKLLDGSKLKPKIEEKGIGFIIIMEKT